MRFVIGLAAVSLFVVADAVACLNEYGTALGGAAKLRLQGGNQVPSPSKIDREFYSNKVASLTETLSVNTHFKDVSDLAVAHLYLGETDRAIELLERAEKQQPNEYVIAANLGTAFELAGRNEDALKWIEEGIRRNPKSHDGSEWVHANLLRAKIAMAADSDWIRTHSVTGAEFGNADVPAYDADASATNCPREPAKIAEHLHYQLYERRQFIPGPDPIVAALMFDLANSLALAETVEEAIPVYQAASELGYHDTSLLEHRISAMQELSKRNPLSGTRYDYGQVIARQFWLCCLVVGLLLAIVVAAYVTWRKKLAR